MSSPSSVIDASTPQTGRSLLELICSGDVPPPAAADLLGIDLERVGDGETTFGFDARAAYGNPGSVHGGVLAAIADFAVTTAIWTLVPLSTDVVTTDLHVSYFKRLHLDDARYRCTGRVVHLGRTQANAVADVVDAAGTVYLHAAATCRLTRI